ncbi:sugar ABC transporter ATP-binding protein [Pengzhenrongella sicca]|uniref:Sugar ABC transporter ATP-binding protein n=1 Tax=Pengzhenrongella sicca TaxID=2819238 RepID=A0A8A4Z951_9MICO|nr:sugar ABC transporter ATP-binding protein [Pengzhenrongella sicca]QTE27951.1 sugar ABC transporter ATP-binding protein [Pengzhenrongella sicca]
MESVAHEPTQAGESPSPRLEIRTVSKRFDAVVALRDVSFTIAPGELHALIGENGAGKSTLVAIVTGLQEADSGAVLLDGETVQFRDPKQARRAGVAAVYQDPNLFPHLSVAENIFAGEHPTRRGQVDKRAMREQATSLLARLGFDIDVDQAVAGLTVAEAQFVEIARAISTDLKILILDEPTSALTPGEAVRLYDVVARLKAEGTSIIWISHRMEEIRHLADTITVLRDGQHVRTASADDLDDDAMIRLMVGRSVVLTPVPRQTPLGPVRLSVRNLSLDGVFDDVSFDVHAGEIVGVAGLVGSGRTEIARAIFGADPAGSGEIVVDGTPVRALSPRQMARRGVVYLPEDRDAEGVISTISVARNIALPSTAALSTFGLMHPSRERRIAREQKAALSIKAEIDHPVSSLSGGNRQKVALARWLATKPAVLLLDEPTHGIDVGTKAQVHDIMRDLAREQGLAILMISSDLPEVVAVSDRVLVMARGLLVADLDIVDATQEAIIAAATRSASLTGDVA